MNLNMDQMCNIGGCLLILVLLALLVLKPNGLRSLIEGQQNNSNKVAAAPKGAAKVAAKVAAPNGVAKAAAPSTTKSVNNNNNSPKPVGVSASLPMGDNEQFASVTGISTPTRSCYPQNTLKPDDLLPADKKNDVNNFNKNYPVSEGILKGVNFLEAGYQVGVNTVGQSLRNANQQLRAEPPNPQVNVSPWQNTTIGPDLGRRPLEIGEDCYAAANNNAI
jgi:hypothetical protein